MKVRVIHKIDRKYIIIEKKKNATMEEKKMQIINFFLIENKNKRSASYTQTTKQ